MDLQAEFGRRLKELRTRKALTQKQLAQRCGGRFATQRVGSIERGAMNVTLATIAALCRGLGCEPLDLFLFEPEGQNQGPALPNRRLRDLWDAADRETKAKMIRVLKELL